MADTKSAPEPKARDLPKVDPANVYDPMTEDDACDAIEDILTAWALQNGPAAKADVTLGSARVLLKSKS